MKDLYINKIVTLLLLVLVSFNMAFAAGDRRNGTGGASELLIPVGVRGVAMGGANIATSQGIEALFWNPAGGSRTENSVEAYFSYMSYIADIGITYGAVSTNINGFGSVALSLKALSIGDIEVTTIENPDGTGQNFTPTFVTVGLTYARNLSDRISVGLTSNLVLEEMGNVNATGIAFNVGVLYENLANITGLSFGVVLKNLGPQMKYDGPGLYTQATVTDFTRPAQFYKVEAASFELPSTLEFGLGYRASINEQNSFLLSSTFLNSNFSGDQYNFGAEYTFNNILSLRGGYTMVPEGQEINYIYGFTGGVGINYNMQGTEVRVDYAYRDVDFFDANHIFSVMLGF